MIKYALVCDQTHEFESWFRSSEDFEAQSRQGLVECPSCRSARVEKAVMAPSVARRARESSEPTTALERSAAPAQGGGQSLALIDEGAKQVREAIRELHAKIMATSVDVGEAFAQEARRMHEGETPKRSIRGRASLQEAQALWEEGVPALPIPALPEECN